MGNNEKAQELINNISYLRSYLYDRFYFDNITDIVMDICSDEISSYFYDLIMEQVERIVSKGPNNIEYTFSFFNKLVMKPFEDLIIEHGSLLDIYRYARDIRCADINKLEDAICKTDLYDKSLYAYLFAYLPGADIKKLGKIVIDSNDIELNYLFAKNFKEADIEEHEKVLLNAKNRVSMDADQYCYLFAKNINGANIEEHAKVLSDNIGNYENDYYNHLFERDVRRNRI